MYSTMAPKKDNKKAYLFLTKAIMLGVTYFDNMTKFFKENFDELAPVFTELKKHESGLDRKQIENLHEAYLSELSDSFSARLGKDRLYERACGFVTDQQIWLIGVLMKYFLRQVMHFEHEDFLTAMKVDLGPLLGETGLWALKGYEQRMQEKGNAEKRKKAQVAQDLIQEYLTNGFEKLGKTSIYNLKNKYCPKKVPGAKKVRAAIPFLYSWNHYAPLVWFQHLRKTDESIAYAQKNNGAAKAEQLCSYCQSPESQATKHKRCSQCKQRLYCSSDC